MQNPTQKEENHLQKIGFKLIAGLDEAGRGPLAGPVVTAAVILPEKFDARGIRDSKTLTAIQRKQLFDYIVSHAVSYSIKSITPRMIDQHNIYRATQIGMQMAVNNLSEKPDFLLIDALNINTPGIAQKSIIKGDLKVLSIAAASILAKVTRDGMMVKFAKKYPRYGFEYHMGYATKNHLTALEKYGPCQIHRMSFEPVRLAARNVDVEKKEPQLEFITK